MKDPTRLKDPGSASPEALRRLIEAGRSEMPGVDRLESLGDRLGVGIGALPAGAAAAKGAAALGGAGVKVGVALVIAVAGAGALVTVHQIGARRPTVAAPTPPSPRASAPSVPIERRAEGTTATTAVAPAPSAEPAPVAPEKPRARIVLPKAAESDPAVANPTIEPGAASHPETEFSLLEQAQRALAAEPQRALDLADRDARLYPAGVLAQEREVIAIEALVKLGRTDEARARAAHFAQAYPGSAHAPRIGQLLDSTSGAHNP